MQALVDIQIQSIDYIVSIEVRISIVIGIPRRCTVGLLVKIQIQGVGVPVVVQIPVAVVAVVVTISISLTPVGDHGAIIQFIGYPITICRIEFSNRNHVEIPAIAYRITRFL